MEIHWYNPNLFREEDRSAAEARILELVRDRTDVIDVRIAARENAHHRHGGHEVRITCQARGAELVAARSRPDAGLALNEALDVFEREVWRMRHRRNQRREERESPGAPPELGVVDEVRLEQGYGFILTDGGERVYFHRNALHGGLDFERLEEGQRVGLNIEGGEKGPQATVVRPAPPDAPTP
jgi:cold shock CspA family protein/ribosome-associated translation inhibitor RaiA